MNLKLSAWVLLILALTNVLSVLVSFKRCKLPRSVKVQKERALNGQLSRHPFRQIVLSPDCFEEKRMEEVEGESGQLSPFHWTANRVAASNWRTSVFLRKRLSRELRATWEWVKIGRLEVPRAGRVSPHSKARTMRTSSVSSWSFFWKKKNNFKLLAAIHLFLMIRFGLIIMRLVSNGDTQHSFHLNTTLFHGTSRFVSLLNEWMNEDERSWWDQA